MILDFRSGWNLSSSKHVEKAWASWTEAEPGVVTKATCGDQEIQKVVAVGCQHLKTCMEFVTEQIKAKRYLFLELPWIAWSWQLLEIVAVASMESVQIVEGHTCAYRLQAVSTSGCAKWVTKPTGLMTNSSCIAVAVSRHRYNVELRREKHHEHSEKSWRDSALERYPMKLVTEALKALIAQLMLRGVR